MSLQFEAISRQYHGLDKNIQRVVLFGGLFLIFSLVDSVMIQPLKAEYDNIGLDIEKVVADRKLVQIKIAQEKAVTLENEKQQDGGQLAQLKNEITLLETSLEKSATQFVTADEMVNFLQDLLGEKKKLTLLFMEKLPIEFTIIKSIENVEKTSSVPDFTASTIISETKVFRHGIRFELAGKYMDIIKYMKMVEELPWRIFWESSQLNAEDYPISTVSFEIYTLSMDENWMTL